MAIRTEMGKSSAMLSRIEGPTRWGYHLKSSIFHMGRVLGCGGQGGEGWQGGIDAPSGISYAHLQRTGAPYRVLRPSGCVVPFCLQPLRTNIGGASRSRCSPVRGAAEYHDRGPEAHRPRQAGGETRSGGPDSPIVRIFTPTGYRRRPRRVRQPSDWRGKLP